MTIAVIILAIVVVVLLVLLAVAARRLAGYRHSARLQDHYGGEYERALGATGDRRSAERQLAERERRHRTFHIRELRPQERDRYAADWEDVQRGFVDDPVRAVDRADALVTDIMHARGYPVEDFDRRAEDLSVEHPQVVARYRQAGEIRRATANGTADTEQQRHAVTSYRALIESLLGGQAHRPSTNRNATTTEERTP